MDSRVQVLSTNRLVLREFCATDVEPMMAVFGDPEVMRHGAGPQSIDWVRRWIDKTITSYSRHGFGLWAVVLKRTDPPIGYCGLTRFDDINGRPEIGVGYRLAKPFWGQGFATEAAIAVRDLSFGDLGLSRLIALIDPSNYRSIRVAEKLGMASSEEALLPGYSHPDRVYFCTAEGFGM